MRLFNLAARMSAHSKNEKHQRSLLVMSFALASVFGGCAEFANAATQHVRVVWNDNPDKNITVAFASNATNPYLRYGSTTNEASWQTANVTRVGSFGSPVLTTQLVQLTQLSPNTAYYMQACDSGGCGQRYWFKTASSVPQNMTFIAGGDSRTNRSVRQQANRLVAKIRPAFVDFGGDLTDSNTSAQMLEWLSDWELTYASDTIDGQSYRFIPGLIVNVGNHEDNDKQFVCKVFGADTDRNGSCSNRDTYGAFNINGNQLRIYNLNSQLRSSAAEHAAQTDWMKGDLAGAGAQVQWRMGAYHVPALPRTSAKSAVNAPIFAWGNAFYDLKMNVIFESDSHLLKVTVPVKPSPSGSDYVEVPGGTVYLGEGAWGAPLRAADRPAAWLLDLYKSYNFNILQLVGEQVHVRSVMIDGEAASSALSREARESNPNALPVGLPLRQIAGADAYVLARDANGRTTRGVSNENQAPKVNAGSDQSLRLPASALLAGSATDDGKPSPAALTYQWSKISGPGTVSFATPNAAGTSATFSAVGAYVLRLTVSDSALSGSDDVIVTVSANKAPAASFSSVSNQLTVSFTDTSSDSDGTIASRLWDFGDGSTASSANVSHTYAIAGTYLVKLTATDNEGLSSTIQRSLTVSDVVSNAPPVANFSYTSRQLAVSFTDSSTDQDGTVSAWLWNFGDGSSSTLRNPEHSYAQSGSYNVSLQATDNAGATSTLTSKQVTVQAAGTEVVLEQSSSGGNKMEVKSGQHGAQSFKHGSSGTSGTYSVSKLTLYLSRESTEPNANLVVSIGTGIQTGEVAGSRVSITPAQISNATGGSSFQMVTLTLPDVVLNAGTTYYINLNNAASNGKAYFVDLSSSATAYTSGSYFKQSSDEKKDMRFVLSGH